jgi:hypothetical protein
MGIQWELYDLKNRRVFDLDKGAWYLADLDRGGALPLSEVHARVNAVMAERYGAQDPDDTAANLVTARMIWAFCEVAGWQIDLWSDTGPDPPEERDGWPLVGSRCTGLFDDFDPDPCAEQMAAKLSEITDH